MFDWKSFSKVNIERCESHDGFNDDRNEWTTFEWLAKAAGEMGEALNAEKKYQRALRKAGKGSVVLLQHVFDEIADVVIYLDLVCTMAGRSLPDVVVEKFNKKSKELGMFAYTFDKRTDVLEGSHEDPMVAVRDIDGEDVGLGSATVMPLSELPRYVKKKLCDLSAHSLLIDIDAPVADSDGPPYDAATQTGMYDHD